MESRCNRSVRSGLLTIRVHCKLAKNWKLGQRKTAAAHRLECHGPNPGQNRTDDGHRCSARRSISPLLASCFATRNRGEQAVSIACTSRPGRTAVCPCRVGSQKQNNHRAHTERSDCLLPTLPSPLFSRLSVLLAPPTPRSAACSSTSYISPSIPLSITPTATRNARVGVEHGGCIFGRVSD